MDRSPNEANSKAAAQAVPNGWYRCEAGKLRPLRGQALTILSDSVETSAESSVFEELRRFAYPKIGKCKIVKKNKLLRFQIMLSCLERMCDLFSVSAT